MCVEVLPDDALFTVFVIYEWEQCAAAAGTREEIISLVVEHEVCADRTGFVQHSSGASWPMTRYHVHLRFEVGDHVLFKI